MYLMHNAYAIQISIHIFYYEFVNKKPVKVTTIKKYDLRVNTNYFDENLSSLHEIYSSI